MVDSYKTTEEGGDPTEEDYCTSLDNKKTSSSGNDEGASDEGSEGDCQVESKEEDVIALLRNDDVDGEAQTTNNKHVLRI